MFWKVQNVINCTMFLRFAYDLLLLRVQARSNPGSNLHGEMKLTECSCTSHYVSAFPHSQNHSEDKMGEKGAKLLYYGVLIREMAR